MNEMCFREKVCKSKVFESLGCNIFKSWVILIFVGCLVSSVSRQKGHND